MFRSSQSWNWPSLAKTMTKTKPDIRNEKEYKWPRPDSEKNK